MAKMEIDLEDSTKIPNDFYDGFKRVRLSGIQRVITDHIIFQTYGRNIDRCKRDIPGLAKRARLLRESAYRAVKTLENQKVLISEGSTIRMNPNIDEWEPSQSKSTRQAVTHDANGLPRHKS